MTPRNLSLSNVEDYQSTQDIGRADQDCHSASAASVITWLRSSADLGTLLGIVRYTTISNSAFDAFFYPAMWVARAFACYTRHRDTASVGDRTVIDAWFLDQAEEMRDMLSDQLAAHIPGRATDNYTTLSTAANTATGYLLYQGGPPIYISAILHNNRRANMVLAVAMIGLYYNVPAMIAEARRYVQEWVRFQVFPAGELGEWERADNYSTPQQGLMYGATNIAVALEVAARFADVGDRSLADYSTTAGVHGTASATPKTIYTPMRTMMDVITLRKRYITPAGNPVLWDVHAQRLCHWGWCLAPAIKLGCAELALQQLKFVDRPLRSENHYWNAWSGQSGIYHYDVRSVAPAAVNRIG
jgi:hypothetical protein